jgi:cobalamin-dependent methionine synthase I
MRLLLLAPLLIVISCDDNSTATQAALDERKRAVETRHAKEAAEEARIREALMDLEIRQAAEAEMRKESRAEGEAKAARQRENAAELLREEARQEAATNAYWKLQREEEDRWIAERRHRELLRAVKTGR